MKKFLQKALDRIGGWTAPRFNCPLCHYRGVFLTERPPTGPRLHARCPGCGALERHRLQFLVLEEVLRERDPAEMSFLHAAPEEFFAGRFRNKFGHYMHTGFGRRDVDVAVDLTRIPFNDGVFDMIFASHVLEHIPNDRRAMAEVARVLKPGGIALLPVPVIGFKTVEYQEARVSEAGHVRCPGRDYFFRFRDHFSRVKLFSSEHFADTYQLCCYEDRERWPASMPDRPTEKGKKHQEFVPVCFK